MRINRRVLLQSTALLLFGSSIASAQAIDAEWVDAVDGAWADPSLWSTDPNSPNNGSPAATDTYDVSISAIGAPYTVLLDADTSISSLGLSSNEATLRLQSSVLAVSGDTSIAGGSFEANDSTLNVNSLNLASNTDSLLQLESSTLNASADVSLNGGSIVARDATLNLTNLTLQSANSSLLVESSTLNLSGAANIATGEVLVDNGVLSGGSWRALFGSLSFSNSFGNILDATTINGDLDLDRPRGSTVHLVNGARFTGTSRIGDSSFLWIDSDVTLNGVGIEIDGAFSGREGVRIIDGATLELGPTSRVNLRSNGASLGLANTGTIINRGTISIDPNNTNGDRFYINPETLVNHGTININGPRFAFIGGLSGPSDPWTNELGGTIEIDGAGVEFRGIGLNRGTITAVNESEIIIDGEWDNDGQLNLTNSDFVIRANLSMEDLGQINATRTSSIVLEGELDNRGETLALTRQTAQYRLQGGSILGGAVTQRGPEPLGFGASTKSVLDNVDVRANLDLSARFSEVEFVNGSAFTGRADLGIGAKIGFSETISIDGATFTVNGGGQISVGGTNTLTLGPNTLVELLGAGSQMTSDLFQEGQGTIVNQGQINAGGRVSRIQRIDPDLFVNQGNLSLMPGFTTIGLTIGRTDRAWRNEATGSIVANSSSLIFEGAGLNQGTISMTDGRLLLDDGWRNEGTIEGANSVVSLGGIFTTDDIGTLSLTDSSTLELRGILDNTGATLQLDALGGLQGIKGQGGTIVGGQIIQGLSAGLSADSSSNLTLDGAFVQGNLDLADTGSTITMTNGAGFDGSAILGNRSRLIYDYTTTLDGVTIDIGFGGGRLEVGNGQELTIGADSVVELSARRAAIGNVSFQGAVEGSLVNLGLIRADIIQTSIETTNFENQGRVVAEGSAVLTVGSSSTTWTNSSAGHILADDSTLRFAGDWANRGTIELTGRSRLETSSLRNEQGGTLLLAGTIVGAIDNAGTFEVGGSRSIGQLQVDGDVVLRSTSILLFDVGAADSDLVDITGTVALDGALAISVLTSMGEEILPEAVFVIADATGGIAGTFSNVSSGERLFARSGGGSFQIFYGEGAFLNQIVATNFVVPEPSTGLLVGIGLIAMSLRRRRS